MIETTFTQLFGLKYPVMSAPMAGAAGAPLVSSVSKAGGLGMLGAGISSPEWLSEQIQLVRNSTDNPMGVGFITHLLPRFEPTFEIALTEKPEAILLSFHNPVPYIARIKEAGTLAICQVQTLEQAKNASAAGVDVLVVQGNEAGGHTGELNLSEFLKQVFDVISDIPVVAAGGIGDGKALAAAISAGAQGASIGTAFLATPEAATSDIHKQKIVESDGTDTLYSEVYDIMSALDAGVERAWPEGIAGRAFENEFLTQWHGREAELRMKYAEIKLEFSEGRLNRDPRYAAMWAGTSAGSISGIRPAAEVLEKLCEEAEGYLLD